MRYVKHYINKTVKPNFKKNITRHILTALCILAFPPHITPAAETKLPVYITAPVTAKESSRSIQICWGSSKDSSVKSYFVMRRNTKNNTGKGKWKTIACIESDGIKGGPAYAYSDSLDSSAPQQYEYKICTLSKNEAVDTRNKEYEEKTNAYTVLGTNVKVCIDPGHYGSGNNNYDYKGEDGQYPYSEAKYTLKIGTALKKELKQAYGIDSYMTRTGSSISLTYNGKTYKNENLDKINISVRGQIAKAQQCDFFISLHTNSTSRITDPWNQPDELNKVYVFVNQKAHNTSRGMKIANTIGTELTAYNTKAGIQSSDFITKKKNHAAAFSTRENDSYNTPGTVIHRTGSRGDDYYGVLRGANTVGVPGILVEHAFHATQIMRKQADESCNLYEEWAACDAYGLASGFLN